MRFLIFSFLTVALFVSVSAQPRQQTLDELNSLKQRAAQLEKIILEPSKKDVAAAIKEDEDFEVFRILPREKTADENYLGVRGGGAYYSFSKSSHDYNEVPQIALEKNYLSVGFYGANYGFIADLGETSLSQIDEESNAVQFLLEYEPPTSEEEAEAEQKKISDGWIIGSVTYRKSISAIVGHTYILRAVSYDEADFLVAFRIYRKDTDGSLIIFWKDLENFNVPNLSSKNKSDRDQSVESYVADIDLGKTIMVNLKTKGYKDIYYSISDGVVYLKGTIPRGKMGDVLRTVQEANPKEIVNNLIEK